MKRKLSVLLLALLVLCAFVGCREREFVIDELPEDSNTATDTMQRPADGTPDDFTPGQNLAIACGVVQATNSFQSVTRGRVTAKVGFINYTQTVLNERQISGGRIFQEAISLSSLRKVAEQKYYEGGKVLRRAAEQVSETPTWAADAKPLSKSEFSRLYGEVPRGLSHYILNQNTILEASEIGSDGELYRFAYTLDTQVAPYYYAREMRTFADAYEMPLFRSIRLEVAMDADWRVREIEVTENYDISMAVIGAINCTGTLTETFSFEETDTVKNADFFAPFLALAPDEDDEEQPDPAPAEPTAASLLTEAFGGYLTAGKLAFAGEIDCGDLKLRPTLAIDLNAFALDFWEGELYLGYRDSSVYLANSRVRARFDAEAILAALSGRAGESGLTALADLACASGGQDVLGSLLESAELTGSGSQTLVTLRADFSGVTAVLRIALDDSGDTAVLQDISGTVSLAEKQVELRLAPVSVPGSPDLASFTDATPLLGYAAPAMNLLGAEHLQMDMSAELRRGAEAYALTASALLDRNASAPAYRMDMGLTGTKELTASAYLVDGKAFVALDKLKLVMPAADVLPTVQEALRYAGAELPLLDSLLGGDLGAALGQLGLDRLQRPDFDAIKELTVTSERLILVLDGARISPLGGNDLTLSLTREADRITSFAIENLNVSGCNLSFKANVASAPTEVAEPENASEYLELDFATVKGLLGFVQPVSDLVQAKQLHLDLSATVRAGGAERFDVIGTLDADLTGAPKLALALAVTGESAHTVEAQLTDGTLYCVYNGKAMKIPCSALNSALSIVLRLLHLEIPLPGADFGPDTSVLDGLGIPDLSAGLQELNLNAILKSVAADGEFAVLEIANALLSGSDESGSLLVTLGRGGAQITSLSATNVWTGTDERLDLRLGVEVRPVSIAAPENAEDYIDFTGIDRLIQVFLNTANLWQYRILGEARLKLLGIDVSVPLEVRIALDENNAPTVWGKLEIPDVAFTTNTKTDTYLYYRDNVIYFRRDLYKRKMVGFLKFEWVIDSTDYLKCTTEAFLSDPATYLVHMLNLTNLVGNQIKDAITGGSGADKGAPAFERTLLNYVYSDDSFRVTLSGAELTQDANIGDIDLTLRCGDELFTSLSANMKMLDLITLNLNASLVNPGDPVDMSAVPADLETDGRYQFKTN